MVVIVVVVVCVRTCVCVCVWGGISVCALCGVRKGLRIGCDFTGARVCMCVIMWIYVYGRNI